jgi:DNA-binding XRE family transcriptional regulator
MNRIKALRRKHKMTQDALGKYLNTTKQTIHKYETEVVYNIPMKNLKQLTELFNVSVEYLYGWDTQSDPKDIIDPKTIYPFLKDERLVNLLTGFEGWSNAEKQVIYQLLEGQIALKEKKEGRK